MAGCVWLFMVYMVYRYGVTATGVMGMDDRGLGIGRRVLLWKPTVQNHLYRIRRKCNKRETLVQQV